jgi:sugar phosphate isomerase/epimerase
MLLGYNTNGFAHHRLEDALAILASFGYRSVALTLDYHNLNPADADFSGQVGAVRKQLNALGLRSVIETGARFLLDPRHKHQPTLLSADPGERRRRTAFLKQAVDLAAELGSDAVSFWSGRPRTHDLALAEVLMDRLADGCGELCVHAARRGVRLAFEPEPGMFIDTTTAYAALAERVDHPSFGLTLDIGHLHCQGEVPLANQVLRWKDRLWNVHLEDMRRGVHEHLAFGEGEIDFPPVLAALRDAHYAGGIHVELSRHSHDAVETARKSFAFLQSVLARIGA